ncbi:Mobile element protein [Microcystis aeruginosa NIES-2549]|uniref:Mobile element protein n=2 Tax=Microcystis aeruginosa TaxID=1126 RepID=A0A0F6U6X9_MICAE|nr:Mobile element protein [Microcystis aeruginosa NIES-2549]AOC54721.1 Mobile element protein [Microcystis aeruginosa NIES-2481]
MLDAQKGKKVLGDRQGKRGKRGNLVAGRRQGKKDFILNPLSIGSDNWDFI